MKKIFTLALTLVSVATFAQRSADISVTMNSPTTGTNIVSGKSFTLNYTGTNMGPDKLAIGDTVVYGLVINNTFINGTIFFRVLTADILKDGVVQSFNQTVTLNIPNELNNANFCAYVGAQNRSFGSPKVSDPATANNLGCSVVNLKTSSIKSLGEGLATATHINATPNPANDVVNISYELVNPETVSVALYDMNGRQVVETITNKQSAGENTVQMNTSELNSGLYFYEVKIGVNTKRYKLMIN